MITSTQNSRVKAVLALRGKARERKKQGLFIVEGPRMFAELPPEDLREVYVSSEYMRQHEAEAEQLLRGKMYEEVSGEVFRAMSDTQNPQGILAVARQKAWTLADVLGKSSGREAERPGARGGMIHRPPLLVILETLQDPGNLGTILRAGEGAGVTGVIMNEESADIYNPKVIRSTMGAIFRVPFLVTPDLRGTIREIREMGIRVYAAHLHGTAAYEEMDYREPSGFLIGNEAAGLTEETAALADARVIIPMAGRVESLNAAIAASVLLFEAARQRRDRKDG